MNKRNAIDMKPFHLSIMVGDIQLVLHIVKGYYADSIQRVVDGEQVPCPHFGVVLSEEEWGEIKSRLVSAKIDLTVNPHKRFIGLPHEQFVMFVKDFSGNGIELKYYTKVSDNEWA